jgi:hypothetical protein
MRRNCMLTRMLQYTRLSWDAGCSSCLTPSAGIEAAVAVDTSIFNAHQPEHTFSIPQATMSDLRDEMTLSVVWHSSI